MATQKAQKAHNPHLRARPSQVTADALTGLRKLGLGGERDSYLFVPDSYTPHTPLPLVLLLHGAGGRGHDGLRVLPHLAAQNSVMLCRTPASTTPRRKSASSGTVRGPGRRQAARFRRSGMGQ